MFRHAPPAVSAPARSAASLIATASAATVLAGCHSHIVQAAPPPAPKPPPQVGQIDLKSYHPNEAGAIMIVIYHRFDANRPNTDMNRTPDRFRQDLQTLYERGYRPVTVSDLVTNKMDVPGGKTPIALTFDDSYESQFRIVGGKDGQPHIDPDCAVGILETFHKTHPDWAMKGTFFILPQEGRQPAPFYQPDTVTDKLAYLTAHGYEIGNHTTTHHAMDRMSPAQVQWELATSVRYLHTVAPGVTPSAIAVPYGREPRKTQRKYLLEGESGGVKYANAAVLLAAWRPVLSPIDKADRRYTSGGSLAVFDRRHLERIHPDARQPDAPGTFEYWLKYFDAHPNERYVSDGNPNVVAVPQALKGMVDQKLIAAEGKTLQPYGFSSVASGPRPALSVE